MTKAKELLDIYEEVSDDDKQELADMLYDFVSSMYVLYFKTQSFHWNVEGSNFTELHNLFGSQYEDLYEAIDVVAERILALGFYAPSTLSNMIENSHISEIDDINDSVKMLEELVRDHGTLAEMGRNIVAYAASVHDEGTIDVVTGRITKHEKTIWMLNSHLS